MSIVKSSSSAGTRRAFKHEVSGSKGVIVIAAVASCCSYMSNFNRKEFRLFQVYRVAFSNGQ